ncbi:glycosyltransferase [Salinarimonas rosea]|uniref:glycosyltransferase n=1 Tax=Salinarimonas rosea TaxID=552063 RepID=UPI000418BB79|nr:glycosyltransferase [Salinarimonas rosea]
MLELAVLLLVLVAATTVSLYRLALRRIVRGVPEAPLAEAASPGSAPAPRVAFLTCTRADEALIVDKIANLAACKAAVPGSRALLFIDGGEVLSVDAARNVGVEIEASPRRVGKIAGLERLLARAGADVAVMSDVNVFLEPDAVRRALQRFADEGLGAVQLVVENRQDDAELAGALGGYARSDLEVCALETRLASMVHLDGSACAVRPSCLGTLVPGMADDQAMAFDVLLAGRRIALHPERAAYEIGRTSLRSELGRKVRVACNSFCTHLHFRERLHELPGRVKAFYVFHKFLRWLLPFQLALIGLLLGVILWRAVGLQGLLAIAAGGLLVTALAAVASQRARRVLVLVAFLAASGWGVMRAMAGRRFVSWQGSRTEAEMRAATPAEVRAGAPAGVSRRGERAA